MKQYWQLETVFFKHAHILLARLKVIVTISLNLSHSGNGLNSVHEKQWRCFVWYDLNCCSTGKPRASCFLFFFAATVFFCFQVPGQSHVETNLYTGIYLSAFWKVWLWWKLGMIKLKFSPRPGIQAYRLFRYECRRIKHVSHELFWSKKSKVRLKYMKGVLEGGREMFQLNVSVQFRLRDRKRL